MRKVLNFIGRNTAFYKTNDKIIVFDCNLQDQEDIENKDIITTNIRVIDIIITDLHDYHIDGLKEMILYCHNNNININIIFPNKKDLFSSLAIMDIDKELFVVKTPSEINDYYLRGYKISNNDNNSEDFSYGYHFINDNDNLFYNNTNNIVPDAIVQMFTNKKVYYIYQLLDVKDKNIYPQVEKIKSKIGMKYQNRIMFMPLCDKCDI